MILVVGATGLLGQEICRRLATTDHPTRALVRADSDPEKVEALKKLGIELVVGDLKDPDSLAAACRGVDQVVSTASSTFSRRDGDSIRSVDRDGQLALVAAAEKAGVERFVFISFPDHPGIDSPLSDAKRVVEQALVDSGMDWCSLQASYFMEVWLSPGVGFDAANGKARIYGAGEHPLSWISYPDVAAFAVAALDSPDRLCRTIPIGGPRAVSPNEVVHLFEKALGRPFEVEHVPTEALAQQQQTAGNPLEASFAALMRAYAEGGPWAIAMEEKLGIQPGQLTSIEAFVQRMTR